MDIMVSFLLMDNDIFVVVFNLNEFGNIWKVVVGEYIGIIVRGK